MLKVVADIRVAAIEEAESDALFEEWLATVGDGVAGYVTPKAAVGAVVYDDQQRILLIQRSDSGVWLYPTGWADVGYSPSEIAVREVLEETGIEAARGRLEAWNVANTFEIYAQWRHRFAPGVTHNTEHVFGLALPWRVPVAIAPAEHVAFAWLPWREAAQRCFSWSNRDSIRMLAEPGC